MHTLLAAMLVFAQIANADTDFRAGRFDDAKAAYSALISANLHDSAALAGRAQVEVYENDLAAAARDAQAALAIDPQNDRAHRVLRTVQIRRGAPGEFSIAQTGESVLPFVVEDPLPIVRFKINGVVADVLIDTGAPMLTLSKQFADAHHIAAVPMGQGTFAGGQTATVYGGHVASVEMPNLTVKNIPVSILPLPDVGPGVHADAVIGTSFFAHFKSTIDYPAHRLIFRRSDAPDAAAPIVAQEPMWFAGDHFLFANARINGGAPQLFNIDTGGGGMGVQLTKASLDAAHITPDLSHAQSFMGGGGAARAAPFAADVGIGPAVQHALPGLYFVDGDQYGLFPFAVAGTVSHEFFKHYAVTFDFAKMRLVLQ